MNRIFLFATSISLLALAGCYKHEKPDFTYMPNMAYSPSVKAQEEGSMRKPVPGTVPRGFNPYPFGNSDQGAAQAGKSLKNPLKRTKAVLQRGKEQFGIYCLVCHGKYGEGDGSIVPKFPRPPTLQSDKVKNYSDGRLYHILTHGQNLMPSYATQVDPDDRWAIVHFLRVLYRAKHPTAADVKKAETW